MLRNTGEGGGPCASDLQGVLGGGEGDLSVMLLLEEDGEDSEWWE